ncbi:MAG: hypothetical protein ACM3PY_22225 [Omnitrophica WOR_2 bacterium]
MFDKSELASRIRETENIIQWAILKVPLQRVQESPPHGKHPHSDKGFKTYFGDWSALRQLFHLTFYEENYAIPAMQYFTGNPHLAGDPVFPRSEIEEKAWHDALATGIDVFALQQRLHGLREVQLRILCEIPEDVWGRETLQTGMGLVSAEFIVMKTIQHSLEHANDILKNALYWERALRWLDRQA